MTAICAWDAKYTFHFWRRVTAINYAAFPDYVSGHSMFSGAAATVLASFYGTQTICLSQPVPIFYPGCIGGFQPASLQRRKPQ
jgi:hypothetical protein